MKAIVAMGTVRLTGQLALMISFFFSSWLSIDWVFHTPITSASSEARRPVIFTASAHIAELSSVKKLRPNSLPRWHGGGACERARSRCVSTIYGCGRTGRHDVLFGAVRISLPDKPSEIPGSEQRKLSERSEA